LLPDRLPVRCRVRCRGNPPKGCRKCRNIKVFLHFLLFIFIYDNESNKEIKENPERKNREPDIRLRVFRSSLPDFVAAGPVRPKFIYGGYLPMVKNKENQQQKQKEAKKVQFIVTREFSGSQTMREAFEQLIERHTCEQFEEWLGKKAS